MTLNEFRAWFDGFSEAIGDAPTPEQWAKIKAKLAQAREPVVVPSMWPQFQPGEGNVQRSPSVVSPNCQRPIIVSGLSNTIARN